MNIIRQLLHTRTANNFHASLVNIKRLCRLINDKMILREFLFEVEYCMHQRQ